MASLPTSAELFTLLEEKRGSDLHLVVGSPPQIRIDGHLVPLEAPVLTPDSVKDLCHSLLTPKQKKDLETRNELDFSFSMGASRIRANLYHDQGNLAAALRRIPAKIPSMEEIGLPAVVQQLISKPHGLILVTGPTGSGKSTTIASMIESINETRHDHIMTIEDPIEYLHPHKKGLVNQREIGQDTEDFKTALKYILRQDPDVILIGEMRDLETIAAAITTAETGHLVFATLHTNTAAQAINRIIDVFPPHQQAQVRTQLSFILEAVLTETLLPKIGGGRILAMEILIPNSAVRNLIREDKSHQIPATMQVGQAESGMQTMNQALAQLVKKGVVSLEEAKGHATDPEEFRKLVGGTPTPLRSAKMNY
ncbi:MAG: type IV pilus twitching motility protein PilT [Deltaproteobacteria bacterium]|nr:type IV pilus twitching motility protein PilT [Deltaproteobacteria bacterium]